MTFDLFTLGETMLRLSPPGYTRLEQASQLHVVTGGSESNLAANLARLGKKTAWFSRLPANPLGDQIINTLKIHGVDTTTVLRAQQERVGLYFVEYGEAPRGIRVWYDRAGSAASKMTPEDLPLDMIADSRWVHLSGITPALSPNCADTVRAALDHARTHNLTTSFDVNYRALLWPHEAAAKRLEPFCKDADYSITALRDAVSLFGVQDDIESAVCELQARWGGTVIITHGDSGVVGFDGERLARCDTLPAQIVDRLGAGDALLAGVICRLLESAELPDALRFGAALAALKLSIPGDIAVTSRAEVETLLGGSASRLSR